MKQQTESNNQATKYWNTYYKSVGGHSPPFIPSQFAAFILSELSGRATQIVDFGCGNGRDSLFFARHGMPTIGVDESEAAIEECVKRKEPNLRFICASINDKELADKIQRILQQNKATDITAYARFFLHAINEETQGHFLRICRDVVGKNGRVALEFRTMRDMNQKKITPKHYRRFVDPLEFMNAALRAGFKTSYFVEGFGYAKYRDDDAHVARFLLEPIV